MFDGGRLESNETLAEQGVEDEDSIEVMLNQNGGGGRILLLGCEWHVSRVSSGCCTV